MQIMQTNQKQLNLSTKASSSRVLSFFVKLQTGNASSLDIKNLWGRRGITSSSFKHETAEEQRRRVNPKEEAQPKQRSATYANRRGKPSRTHKPPKQQRRVSQVEQLRA